MREEVRAGRFREDLLYRLRVVPIFLPALRERPRDIAFLLDHFMAHFNQKGPRRVQQWSTEAREALLRWKWPGNVRELQNVVEYAFAVGRGPIISLQELPPEFREEPSLPSAPVQDLPTQIQEALLRAGGDLGRAAELLGMSRTTFWRHRRKLGI